MSKIDEWQAVLKKYDEANLIRDEHPGLYRVAAYETMNAAQEAFRKLLALAAAAVELRDYQETIGGNVIPNNREVEHLMGLYDKYLDALKALDKPDEP